jgi:hypothetical protein
MPMLTPLQFLQKSHRRKTLETVVDGVKRATRLGNYWYWLQIPELEAGVDISSLICPLRYDVIVRRDFYSFYAAQRDLYNSDFDTFVKLVGESSYFTWYVRSDTIRSRPYLLDDPDSLWIRFVNRIRKAVALFEDMLKNGYDERTPIILKTAEHLLPPTGDRREPPTGKFISDRYFMADGCHRLAFLMMMGITVLPADHFRVKCFREFSPFDSTSLLAGSLPITPKEYFTFLSSRYCHPAIFESGDSFFGYIRDHRPELVDELLSIVQVDGFDSELSSLSREALGSDP